MFYICDCSVDNEWLYMFIRYNTDDDYMFIRYGIGYSRLVMIHLKWNSVTIMNLWKMNIRKAANDWRL